MNADRVCWMGAVLLTHCAFVAEHRATGAPCRMSLPLRVCTTARPGRALPTRRSAHGLGPVSSAQVAEVGLRGPQEGSPGGDQVGVVVGGDWVHAVRSGLEQVCAGQGGE